MKKCLFLTMVLIALLILGGCGSKEEALYSKNNPLRITVWSYYNGAQLSSFNDAIDAFNSTRGAELGIVVEGFSQGSVTDLKNGVLDAARGKVGAGDTPNIFAAYADTAYELDQMGLVADLNSYFTQEERERYIASYLYEGDFKGDGSIKIFPVAKATEVFVLNTTDFEPFAAATGVTEEDFSTIEGLVEVARLYYEWTDSLTQTPNDGKAFFGRDAMANYMLIGAMQLGTEIFSINDAKATINFDIDTARKLWDNYYVPYVQGYFASSGRFRSDDVKTGNVIAFVGSTAGATFFPEHVVIGDDQSYDIQMRAYPAPQFANCPRYAVQQGAGMVVVNKSEAEISASVEFLKWFTQDEYSTAFSVASGYLPVTQSANDIQKISQSSPQISSKTYDILKVAVETVNSNTLYTNKAFVSGSQARTILETTMQNAAEQDRMTVVERLKQGMSLEEAAAPFLAQECFERWYNNTVEALDALGI